MPTPASSKSSDSSPKDSFSSWQRVVQAPDHQLFRRALVAYRWALLEGLVRAASNEQMHQLRGAILMADWVLGSAPAAEIKQLLGLDPDPPTPPPDYMREEETDGR